MINPNSSILFPFRSGYQLNEFVQIEIKEHSVPAVLLFIGYLEQLQESFAAQPLPGPRKERHFIQLQVKPAFRPGYSGPAGQVFFKQTCD